MGEVRKIRMETVKTPGIEGWVIVVGGVLFYFLIAAFFFTLPNVAQFSGFNVGGLIFAAGAPILLFLCLAWGKHSERKLKELNDRQRQENRAAGKKIGLITGLK